MDYNQNQSGSSLWGNQEELDKALSSCLVRVFVRMFMALILTALSALVVVFSPPFQMLIFGNTGVMFGLIILELVLVIAISFGLKRFSTAMCNIMFYTYAVVNGLTLSVIFFVYDIGTIYLAFGISALMFAAIAVYGAVTKRNLSSIGSICLMGLFGIIIAGLVNFFLRSDMLDTVICFAGILIFIGLTAYDTQRIKSMLAQSTEMQIDDAVNKITVIGALTLYLDFINLFLKILRILGKRR